MIEHPMQITEESAHRALELSREIGSLLAGKGAAVQGAALANLVSLWLAGIIDLDADDKMAARCVIFADWTELVVKLLPASIEEVMSKVRPEGSS